MASKKGSKKKDDASNVLGPSEGAKKIEEWMRGDQFVCILAAPYRLQRWMGVFTAAHVLKTEYRFEMVLIILSEGPFVAACSKPKAAIDWPEFLEAIEDATEKDVVDRFADSRKDWIYIGAGKDEVMDTLRRLARDEDSGAELTPEQTARLKRMFDDGFPGE